MLDIIKLRQKRNPLILVQILERRLLAHLVFPGKLMNAGNGVIHLLSCLFRHFYNVTPVLKIARS